MIFQSPALSCFCGHLKMNYEGVTTSNVCYCSMFTLCNYYKRKLQEKQLLLGRSWLYTNVWNSPNVNFLFTCSDTSAVGCVI